MTLIHGPGAERVVAQFMNNQRNRASLANTPGEFTNELFLHLEMNRRIQLVVTYRKRPLHEEAIGRYSALMVRLVEEMIRDPHRSAADLLTRDRNELGALRRLATRLPGRRKRASNRATRAWERPWRNSSAAK